MPTTPSGSPSSPVSRARTSTLPLTIAPSLRPTGNGKAFSAGFDLKSASGLSPPEDVTPDLTTGVSLEGEEYCCQGIKGGTGFAGLTDRDGIKPVIAGGTLNPPFLHLTSISCCTAAVNGIAHGGGFETALACDVIIASENADFALPEPKVGLYAAAGGAIRLPRLIGYHNALSLILTGRRVKGEEAVRLGIASQVPRNKARALAHSDTAHWNVG